MTRKKKESRKYIPVKYNVKIDMSPVAKGHPGIQFGKTRSGKNKLFGLTTEPNERTSKIKLPKNTNPKDDRDAYILTVVRTSKDKHLKEPYEQHVIPKEDMPIIRYLVKKYKKSQNKKPKGWYDNKKK